MKDPVEIKYREALSRDRPQHATCDEFSLRHPKMPLEQRAKIFASFSALTGFEERIEAKLERYVEKRELTDEEQAALDRALAELYDRTRGRARGRARDKPVYAAVTWYMPCPDEQHEAYGLRGSYQTVSGRVWRVDPVLTRTLQIGEMRIEFSDLAVIEIIEAPGEE